MGSSMSGVIQCHVCLHAGTLGVSEMQTEESCLVSPISFPNKTEFLFIFSASVLKLRSDFCYLEFEIFTLNQYSR